MNRLVPARLRIANAPPVAAALTLLLCSGCGRVKPSNPPPTNAPAPRLKAPPDPAPTHAPPQKRMEARTPVELFQAGLKLWDGKGAAKDPAEAVKLFLMAAERGNVEAQAYLAGAYRTGVGVVKNPDETVRWFRSAAEQGDARSQGVLASLYGTGEGVPKNLPEAAKWYQMAAEQGLVRAQANLGAMYFLGQGVPKDPIAAYMWLHLAAQKGDPDATKNRGLVAYKLSASQMAEGRKRASEFVPAKSR